MKIKEVIKYLEFKYPKKLAVDKDPIGLHIGDVGRSLTKVLVTLDVTLEVVQEAIDLGANLIVAHHPFIYRPLKAIDTQTAKGRIVEKCLKHDMVVYAMHTNYDIAPNGMSDAMAEALALTKTRPLVITAEEPYAKVAVFVPSTHAQDVRKAMGRGGVGQLGDYSHCTFSAPGTGCFMPLEGSQPYMGAAGELETVEEVKIEGISRQQEVAAIMDAVRAVHPYEEIAYDIYPIQAPDSSPKYGLGRIGGSHEPLSIKEYIPFTKGALGVANARYSGSMDQVVKTVAVLGGSGSNYMGAAKAKGADLYITGDMGFHNAQDAMDMGLNVLDVGHYAEAMMKHHVGGQLQEQFPGMVEISKISTDPFVFV